MSDDACESGAVRWVLVVMGDEALPMCSVWNGKSRETFTSFSREHLLHIFISRGA